jgi:hypothetical protein
MAIHLRQICLVAGDLSSAIDPLCGVFDTPVCYEDPAVAKYGLQNALLGMGTQFLEVVAPTQGGTAAGRYLQRRGGDGGYMVICQVLTRQEQVAVRDNATANGVRVAHESDRGNWYLLQLHPGDMGASFLSVEWDDQEDVTGNWEPAGGMAWVDRVPDGPVTAITGAELQADDPQALAERWGKVAGLPVVEVAGAPQIALANAALRFVPATDGRGPGLSAVTLTCSDRDGILKRADRMGLRTGDTQLVICGTRFDLG